MITAKHRFQCSSQKFHIYNFSVHSIHPNFHLGQCLGLHSSSQPIYQCRFHISFYQIFSTGIQTKVCKVAAGKLGKFWINLKPNFFCTGLPVESLPCRVCVRIEFLYRNPSKKTFVPKGLVNIGSSEGFGYRSSGIVDVG